MADTQQQSESRESLDPRTFFEQWEGTDSIQTDRFCLHCGYNLRGQMIRRDPMTKLLVYRCSECGHFYSANETVSWIDRFAARFGKGVVGKTTEQIVANVKTVGGVQYLLGLIWIGIVLAALLGACVVHMLITIPIIDETARYIARSGGRQDQLDLYAILMAGSLATSAWSFIALTISALILPHWKKAYFIPYAIFMPIPGTCVALLAAAIGGLPTEFCHFSLVFGIAAISGGLIAVRNGRALLRGLVRAIVPPQWRGPVAFLWTTDGLNPPLGDSLPERTS